MRKFVIAAAAILTLVSTTGHAETSGKLYGGLGYNTLGDDDFNLGTIIGRIGYDITPNFAVEAEAGFGITEEKLNVGFGATAKAKVDSSFGAFVVGKYPASDKFEVFGRLGYTTTKIGVDTNFGNGSGDIDSFAVGVGGQYMIDDKNGIRADYLRLTEDEGANSFSVSYVRKF
jgi:outer membrane immunogenic protein